MEIWKEIPTFEYYEVSTEGNVRNCITKKHLKQFTNGKQLYKKVCLRYYNKKEYVHRLVVKTFIQTNFEGLQVHHKDHNPENNNIVNLELVCFYDNILKRCETGKDSLPRPYRRKIQVEKIEEIRQKYAKKSIGELAAEYKVSTGVVYDIVNKRRAYE